MYGVTRGNLLPQQPNKLRTGTYVALAAPVFRVWHVSIGRCSTVATVVLNTSLYVGQYLVSSTGDAE